jgi:hypothetical protein
MGHWIASAQATPGTAQADLDAFFRHRRDAPVSCGAALISALSRLHGSDDPVVAFGRLPEACVPDFADGCQVELSDGSGPSFRAVCPVSPGDDPGGGSAVPVGPQQLLVTPFRAVSLAGCASYAGVVTFWWTGRPPAESDAVIADLLVRHLVALVEHERLLLTVARAEDRAANLALEAISGRTINLATGIVMYQNGLQAADAEHLLRQSAGMTGRDLHQVAASVVRSGSLGAGPQRQTAPDAAARSSSRGPEPPA